MFPGKDEGTMGPCDVKVASGVCISWPCVYAMNSTQTYSDVGTARALTRQSIEVQILGLSCFVSARCQHSIPLQSCHCEPHTVLLGAVLLMQRFLLSMQTWFQGHWIHLFSHAAPHQGICKHCYILACMHFHQAVANPIVQGDSPPLYV